jgi:ankyrin repeat protein
LYYVEGGEEGIKYILEKYSNKLNIETIISLIDSDWILEKYIQNNQKKVDINKLLITACEYKKIKTLKKLINLGADINVLSGDKNLLMIAIENNDLEMVKFLVERGINLEHYYIESGEEELKITPFIMSIITNNQDIFRYLIEAGVDINNGFPLFFAIDSKNLNMAKIILKRGETPTKEEQKESLLKSIVENKVEFVKLFLENNFDLTKSENLSITPFQLAILKNNKEVLKLFLNYGYTPLSSELKTLINRNDISLSKEILKHNLGENYREKLQEKLENIMFDREFLRKVDIKDNIEKKYEFEKYKKYEKIKENEKDGKGKNI